GARSRAGRQPCNLVQLRQQPGSNPHQPRAASICQSRAQRIRLSDMQESDMSTTDQATTLTDAVAALVKTDLAPIAGAVDQEGRYPVEFLRKLGNAGGYA